MIEIRDLRKSYGDNTVFSNFSHTFPAGLTLLTGNSGCGKTTLLRLIAGLEKADRGKITCSGSLSFMFQEPRLFPWYTAERNIALISDEKKAAALLAELDMADSAGKYPYELSGGMQRRVALARTLSCDAEIYLFDEPFSGLDRTLKQRAASLIDQTVKQNGRTAIVVSHETEFLDPFVNSRLSLTDFS